MKLEPGEQDLLEIDNNFSNQDDISNLKKNNYRDLSSISVNNLPITPPKRSSINIIDIDSKDFLSNVNTLIINRIIRREIFIENLSNNSCTIYFLRNNQLINLDKM